MRKDKKIQIEDAMAELERRAAKVGAVVVHRQGSTLKQSDFHVLVDGNSVFIGDDPEVRTFLFGVRVGQVMLGVQ